MNAQRAIYCWLLGVGLAHALGGVVLIALVDMTFMQGYLQYLATALNALPSDHITAAVMLKLFGPTVASWGLLFCLAVDYFYRTGKRVTKWITVCAILLWLLLDSGISASYGLYWHWIINALAGVSLLLPLLFLTPKIWPKA